MAFVDRLKEKIKRRVYEIDEYDEFEYLRNNPKYAQVLNKLDSLIVQRDELYKQLAKLEVDIDSCLVLISLGLEKDDIDNKKRK